MRPPFLADSFGIDDFGVNFARIESHEGLRINLHHFKNPAAMPTLFDAAHSKITLYLS